MDENYHDARDESFDSLLPKISITNNATNRPNYVKRALLALHAAVTLTLFAAVAVFLLRENRCPAVRASPTDFSQFVPSEASERHGNVHSPYYASDFVKLDIFRNISILEQRIDEMGLLHISTAVKTSGKYTSWTDEHSGQRMLYPILTQEGEEAYVIAGLHQMHCLMLTIREFGYLLNGFRPAWSDAHIAHCFNLFYAAITCLSDSRIEGISSAAPASGGLPPLDIQKVSETQQPGTCRDFNALHRWAQEPVRGLPFKPLSGHKEVKVELPLECSPANCRDGNGWIGDDRDGTL